MAISDLRRRLPTNGSSRPVSLTDEMGIDYSYSQPSQSATFGGDASDSDSNEIEALIQEDQAQLEYEHSQAFVYPPQPESGDCGVYCLKYIECHALGVAFSPHDLCDKKIKAIRSQLASEIFDETSINGTKKRVFNHLGVYD
ncbi:hypothetical protein Rs2_15708 [Raphanus sativus]|nr:hypothetical protein Rs2_15708 [Raphanus sativus]